MFSQVLARPENFSADIEISPVIAGTAEDYELRFARRALAKIKERLGAEAIEELLQPDIDAGENWWTNLVAKDSGYDRCAVQLSMKGLTIDEFMTWFHTRAAKSIPSMQAAEPEHWVITSAENGDQKVIENLGDTIVRFYITFEPPNQPFQVEDLMDDFPVKLSGRAKLASGGVAAYVLHQFRPHVSGVGFDANLRAYFPKAAGEDMIEQHRQHLVVEFTNWARHCFQELKFDGLQL